MSAASSTSLREEKLSRSPSAASTAFQSSRADGKDSVSRSTSLFGGAGKKDGKPDVTQGELGAIEEEVDGVFGEQGGADTIDYRSVGWVWTSIILMKLQIGLGVLNIPSALGTLGLVPGLIILILFAGLTGWTDIVIGMFKLAHPQVYSLADCGRLMYGRIGGIVFGFATWMYMAMVTGSAFIGISTAFNAITLHATCTAVWVMVAAVVTYPLASLPKIESLKVLGWIALVSIVSAVMIVVISVAVGDRPALAPQDGPFTPEIKAFGNPSFAQAMNAVANLLLAFAGTPAYLPVACEMKKPSDFRKAVIFSQTVMTAFYIVVGVVLYTYANPFIASPALGTAGVLVKRISYGIALPGLFFTAIIYNHLAAKFIFVRVLRGSHHLNHPTAKHWAVWLSCTGACLLFSYVVAEAIPVFSGLVGLVSALFGTMMALHAEALMYLYDTWAVFKVKERRTPLMWFGIFFNVAILVIATVVMGGGTYGSVLNIRDDYSTNGGRPWSCADNSGSS
ncbi:hypothetical protein JCM8208_007062 [Rhodotorula glutinis]